MTESDQKLETYHICPHCNSTIIDPVPVPKWEKPESWDGWELETLEQSEALKNHTTGLKR